MKTQTKQKTVNKFLTFPLIAFTLVSANTIADSKIINGDFNGDGLEDMIVGIPDEDVGNIKDAGAISVFYGTRSGLGSKPTYQLHQDTPRSGTRASIPDKAEKNDRFGSKLAVGDFDNDGYDDAVIRAGGDQAVHILYGSRRGVWGIRNSILTMEGLGYLDKGSQGNGFGSSFAVGDVNDDGYVDLAVGAPNHDANGRSDAGAVMVLYGSASGLKESRAGLQLIFQSYAMVPGDAESNDHFGAALAMNDFDQDGHTDLAIGIPGEDLNLTRVKNAGGVVVLYGVDYGILGGRSTFFSDDRLDPFDYFGQTLTTGDFDGNGYPDLAVGHPRENGSKGQTDSGAVTVIFSTDQGLIDYKRQELTQASGIDKEESNDFFGGRLAAADFNGDGIDELVVGTPGENHERRFRSDYYNSGLVSVFYGTSGGLEVRGDSRWHQDKRGVEGRRKQFNDFGDSLGIGDYNNDGLPDLAVGVPGEDLYFNGAKKENAGVIQIFYGQYKGLSTNRSLGQQRFHEPLQTEGRNSGAAEKEDGFGGDAPYEYRS